MPCFCLFLRSCFPNSRQGEQQLVGAKHQLAAPAPLLYTSRCNSNAELEHSYRSRAEAQCAIRRWPHLVASTERWTRWTSLAATPLAMHLADGKRTLARQAKAMHCRPCSLSAAPINRTGSGVALLPSTTVLCHIPAAACVRAVQPCADSRDRVWAEVLRKWCNDRAASAHRSSSWTSLPD